jgi:hypothetical protein
VAHNRRGERGRVVRAELKGLAQTANSIHVRGSPLSSLKCANAGRAEAGPLGEGLAREARREPKPEQQLSKVPGGAASLFRDHRT